MMCNGMFSVLLILLMVIVNLTRIKYDNFQKTNITIFKNINIENRKWYLNRNFLMVSESLKILVSSHH